MSLRVLRRYNKRPPPARFGKGKKNGYRPVSGPVAWFEKRQPPYLPHRATFEPSCAFPRTTGCPHRSCVQSDMGRSHAVKTIAPLSVAALLLVELSGAMPRSSVGGPLTIMLIMLIAMLAVGIHEAWTKKRGPLGWIASIVAAVIGGFVAASLVSLVMDMIRPAPAPERVARVLATSSALYLARGHGDPHGARITDHAADPRLVREAQRSTP